MYKNQRYHKGYMKLSFLSSDKINVDLFYFNETNDLFIVFNSQEIMLDNCEDIERWCV